MAATDERKPVTVLFADLSGSTELATKHDPEHLRALLSAFFDEMRQQIEAFGGTVEKFAGDAILAVFGVPRVNEDDAERAVRAAFAMQESLAQLNPMFDQEYGAHLVLRIGIATGEAVAASRAVNDFMVTGEVPNLAARLQAVGDGITVSETTHRLLAPRLEAERLEPLSLKGFSRPITAYRALELRETERRHRGVTGLSSPVVGRDRELAAAVHDAGERVIKVKEDVFELRRSTGECALRFTTRRDLAWDDEGIDLLGLDHPLIVNALERWRSVRAEQLGGAVQGNGSESGVVSWWFVESRGERGGLRFHVQALAVTLDGRRMPSQERLGEALLHGTAATSVLDYPTRLRLLTEQIEPMLNRELQQRGLGGDGGGFSARLIGSADVRGKQGAAV